MENQTSKTKNKTMVPVAIIVAGVLIAGAVLYSNNGASQTSSAKDTSSQKVAQDTGSTNGVNTITAD